MHRCYFSVCSKLSHVQSITKLAYDLDQINQGELKRYLFEYIKDKNKIGEKLYHLYVDEIFKVFCGKDDSLILRPFAEEYFYGTASAIERKWTEDQLEYLFSNEFVRKWVDSITGFTDTKALETLLWCIGNLTGTTDITYQLMQSKMSTLWGTSDGKTEDDFIQLFDFVNPLLHAMRNDASTNKEQLVEFVKLVFAERRLPGTPSSTRRLPISIGCGADLSNVLVESWFEAYRLVGGDSLPVMHLTNLLKQSEQRVKQYLLGMLNENKNVSSFRDCISNMAIADTEMFHLFPILYEKKPDGLYYCDKSILSDKIVVLLSHLENDVAVDVLVQISKDEDIKDIILSKIAMDDYDYLNRLPSKLLSLVLTAYNEDSRNVFEMNNAFLMTILQKGSAKQKALVKTSLLSRLLEGKDRTGVLELKPYCKLTKLEQEKFDALMKEDSDEDE